MFLDFLSSPWKKEGYCVCAGIRRRRSRLNVKDGKLVRLGATQYD